MGNIISRLFKKKKKKKSVEKLPDPQYNQSAIGITPFLREADIRFGAKNLKPGSIANLFFDDIKVNNFAQRASIINVDSSSVFSSIKLNQGFYGANSNAYAEVIGTSVSDTQKLMYVNNNFLTILVRKDPADPVPDPVSNVDFGTEQLVYQTADGLRADFNVYSGLAVPYTTFMGVVKKFINVDSTQCLLVVEPKSGRINAVSTIASSNLWNWSTGTNKLRNAVRIDANNQFRAGEALRYLENDAIFANVSAANSFTALSSIATAANVGNSKTLVISTNNISRDGIGNLVGNTLYIVSGTGVGFNSMVQSVATNTFYGWTEAVLYDNLPYVPDNTTVYSFSNHTVDDVGALYGIFHVPAYQNMRWITGERLFTITDTANYNDNGYKMRAIAKYTSVGFFDASINARAPVTRELTPSTLQIAPSVIGSTQKINDRKFMAQTFFTPKGNQIVNGVIKNAYGVFVSSIDLYFRTKPTDSQELFPFTVAITRVVDGLPSNEIIAEKTLEPAYIVTPTVTVNGVTRFSDAPPSYGTPTFTKFTFQDPVYLLPGTEYAIQLITESPDYEVWTAIMGDEYVDANGNTRRVSEQPYVGKFFKSQNASQWAPILNQDLMFQINRASFSTSPSVVYFDLVKGSELQKNIFMDAVKLTATEQQFAPTNINYELTSYLTDETPTKVELINNEFYSFGKDTTVSSVTSKRRRMIKSANNAVSVNVKVTMSTTDESVSPIINRERIGLIAVQNIINNAGLSNNLITITNGGRHLDPSNVVVTISPPDIGSRTATANIIPALFNANTANIANVDYGSVVGINIIDPGSGYFTTPTITISEPGALLNATAVINGETDASGGNILAKYQTKIVTLKDGFDAGDLVVRMDAIKPQGTQIAVYFKVLSAADTDPFVSKTWQKMTPVVDLISPDQSTSVSIEYRYSLNNGRISYFDGRRSMPLNGNFKYFAVKIRMTAEDPTVMPLVESMTVLAVPGDEALSGIDGGYYSGT
jgi:hypothetical protein